MRRAPSPPRLWALALAGAGCAALACGGEAPEPTAPRAAAAPATASPAPPDGTPEKPEPGPTLPDFATGGWNRLESRAGNYVIQWRSTSGTIPRNAEFALEAWVLRDGAPARDALLDVRAWMPDHGHGMLRRPRAEQREDGSWLVEGMLLHMRGHWQLFFDLLSGSLAEAAETAVDL